MPRGFTFFDTKAVTDKVAPAVRKVLSKFGAFTRKDAKSSLKYKDGAASPGQPPHVHRSQRRTKTNKKTGKVTTQSVSPLRELLFFGYDATNKSVVVGPALGGPKSGAPRTLEEGGTAKDADGKTLHIHPHPTMKPAFDRSLKTLRPEFKGVIR